MKKKDIYIDADGLIYTVAYAQGTNASLGGSKVSMSEKGVNIKAMKAHYKRYVKDLYKSVEVLSITENWKPGKVHLVFSDKTNFRYDIYPEYKANRTQEKTEQYKKLKKWALKKGLVVKNCEADDVVSYYVRKGAIGMTADKDMLNGVAGIWYDTYHQKWITTSKEEADKFVLIQSMMGDATDNIKGIFRVGIKTAERKLEENGATWDTVVQFYKEKGLTEEDAILTRRLVGMDQWHPKKGIRLWK